MLSALLHNTEENRIIRKTDVSSICIDFTVPMKDAYGHSDRGYFDTVRLYELFCTPSSDQGLNSTNVQKIIHSQNMHFDLVINEDYFHESWLMFAYKFNAPIVTICMNEKLFDLH